MPPYTIESKKSKFSALEYSVIDNHDKLIIKVESKVPLVNKLMLACFFIWFVSYSAYQTYSNPDVPGWLFYYVLFLGLVGAAIGLLVARKILHRSLGIRKIILDKKEKTIESPSDSFKVPLSSVRDVIITEKQGLFRPISLLKFQLVDGEKTIMFSFQTYNQAQKILKILKENIEKSKGKVE